MKTTSRAILIVISFLSMWSIQAGDKTSKKPNILWLFSDDHAFQAIGAYGGRFEKENLTPNIDALATDGMRFDRCYVGNSICAPSRATLLTGKHSHKNGKKTNYYKERFDHDQQQFQKILQNSGYQTAMIGKIHLDGAMQGFDYWEVLPGQGKYWDPIFVTAKGRTVYEGKHSTNVIKYREHRSCPVASNGYRTEPKALWSAVPTRRFPFGSAYPCYQKWKTCNSAVLETFVFPHVGLSPQSGQSGAWAPHSKDGLRRRKGPPLSVRPNFAVLFASICVYLRFNVSSLKGEHND